MKKFNKFKGVLIGFGAYASMQAAMAQGSFNNIQGNGNSLGTMSKNISTSFIDGASAVESFLYLAGIIFICLFIFTLVKWKKTDGQQGNPGLIGVYLVASVFCMAAPTLMGAATGSLFGSGTVTNVKPAGSSTPVFN